MQETVAYIRSTDFTQHKKLVNWCFEPSQPPGIISRLTETFIKRYGVERINKTEVRLE